VVKVLLRMMNRHGLIAGATGTGKTVTLQTIAEQLSDAGVALPSLVGLETGGGTEFFGEPQLDIADLISAAPDGRGVISCLELPAVQGPRRRKREPDAATARTGGLDVLSDFLTSREGKARQKKVMRGVFGMLRKRL
jgi:hypothetical protein